MPTKSAAPTDVTLRIRRPRGVDSARVQSLARTGAAGGVLTPREVKEVCQAVVAIAEGRPALGRRKADAGF